MPENAAGDAVTIHVDTNSPFTLEVDTGFATKTFDIKAPGRTTLKIPNTDHRFALSGIHPTL